MPSLIRSALYNWKARNRVLLSRLPSVLVIILEHVLYLGGLASITYGFWLARDLSGLWRAYPNTHPFGYLAGGILGVYLAFTITAERAFDERSRRNKLE